jgi:nucleoside-diphosphate-sugar epimerase
MKRYEVEQCAATKKAMEKVVTDYAKNGWEVVGLVPGMSVTVLIVFATDAA